MGNLFRNVSQCFLDNLSVHTVFLSFLCYVTENVQSCGSVLYGMRTTVLAPNILDRPLNLPRLGVNKTAFFNSSLLMNDENTMKIKKKKFYLFLLDPEQREEAILVLQ